MYHGVSDLSFGGKNHPRHHSDPLRPQGIPPYSAIFQDVFLECDTIYSLVSQLCHSICALSRITFDILLLCAICDLVAIGVLPRTLLTIKIVLKTTGKAMLI